MVANFAFQYLNRVLLARPLFVFSSHCRDYHVLIPSFVFKRLSVLINGADYGCNGLNVCKTERLKTLLCLEESK